MGESTTLGEAAHHAFITNPVDRAMMDLGSLGGPRSAAIGINNTGQVTGYSDTSVLANDRPNIHAFIVAPNSGAMTDRKSTRLNSSHG